MKTLRTFLNENERLFKQDNPGGEWEERHRKTADEKMEKYKHMQDHSISKGYTGKTTGYFKKTLHLPVKHLKHIPGAQGEEHYRNNFNSHKHKELSKSVEKHGFNSKDHPILIGVNHKGKPHVLEGNHRLAHAVKHGHEKIHADVRYWNGGEKVKGQGFHPDQVEHLHHHGDYKGLKDK